MQPHERANMLFAAAQLAGSRGDEEESDRLDAEAWAIVEEFGLEVRPRGWSEEEEQILGDPTGWFEGGTE